MRIKEISNFRLRTIRIIIFFWLFGWFLKVPFFVPYLFYEISAVPIHNAFFPAWLSHPLTAQISYFLPLFVFGIFFSRNLLLAFTTPFILCLCSAILNLHLDTHNDATFVTSFWVAIFLGWFMIQEESTDEHLLKESRSISQWIIGLIFMGGFIGKLTPEYWNGQLFSILCQSENNGLMTWLRGNFSLSSSELIAKLFSRTLILSELTLALSPFLSFRVVQRFAPILMIGMALFRTWRIFSVLSCLIGLMIALKISKESPPTPSKLLD